MTKYLGTGVVKHWDGHIFLYQGNIKRAGVTVDYKIDRKMADEIRELSHAGKVMQELR